MIRVNIGWSNLAEATLWAAEHCPHFIGQETRYEHNAGSGYSEVSCDMCFEDHAEATMFRLRWQ